MDEPGDRAPDAGAPASARDGDGQGDQPAAVARMHGVIRSYPWGSYEVIARLQGRVVPSEHPEAELWFGTHPAAPGLVELADGSRSGADEWLGGPPGTRLGDVVPDQHGSRLPFLLKFLAIAEPLSLQLHPTADTAQAGFAAEEAAGVPRDAPHRRYRDPYAKRELLVALTPVAALCGLRSADRVAAVLDLLGLPALAPVRASLAEGVPAALSTLLHWPGDERAGLVDAVAHAATEALDGLNREGSSAPVSASLEIVGELARRYPRDPGVVASLLLTPVRLAPGEALHVPPGVLHCYLSGEGVEVMVASDNVLRGGLTSKPVDVEALLENLVTVDGDDLLAQPCREGSEDVYDVGAVEFRLSRAAVRGRVRLAASPGSPQLLLVTDGDVRVGGAAGVDVSAGTAALIAADAGDLDLAGDGDVFRVWCPVSQPGRPGSERTTR